MLDEADLSDIRATYTVGEPLTFEQMQKVRCKDRESLVIDPFEGVTEKCPYLFEDKPVGAGRFALINMVAPGLAQTHAHDKMFIKIKCVTSTVQHGHALARSLQKRSTEQKFGIYLLEMFKFACIPPLDVEDEERDVLMNDAIREGVKNQERSLEDFRKRKQAMLAEVARHNEIAARIASGELPPEAAESECIVPEACDKRGTSSEPAEGWQVLTEDGALTEQHIEGMEMDQPLSVERYIVMATMLVESGQLKGRVIYKICGAFEGEEKANEHMISLKKLLRYKMFDVSVASMYGWLEMPPPYEQLERVHYDSA
eukprot:6192754-Pleurochrysis_carterae.AAC.1